MNLAAMRQRVLARMGTDSNDMLAANVDSWINDGIQYLGTVAANGFDWLKRTVTFTATSDSYSFDQLSSYAGQPVVKVLHVRVEIDGTRRVLSPVPYEEAYIAYQVDTRGTPEVYAVTESRLFLFPTPPSSGVPLTVQVLVAEKDLVNDGDTPLMPVTYHGAIIDAALLLFYSALQDDRRMEVQEARVNRWVDRMLTSGSQDKMRMRVTVRNPLL